MKIIINWLFALILWIAQKYFKRKSDNTFEGECLQTENSIIIQPKKSLILGLDETLVRSSLKPLDSSFYELKVLKILHNFFNYFMKISSRIKLEIIKQYM